MRALFALLLAAGAAEAKVKGEAVEYKDGDTVLQGYVAYDDEAKAPQPAVIVFHEWKGHDAYVRRRAEQLAGLGYVAFAADVYGKGVLAKDHEEAGKLAGMYRSDRKLMQSRAKAALDAVSKDKRADKARVAAIGYCFGGTTALEMARAGMPVRGVAGFHAGLESPTKAPKGMKAKVLVLQGAADKWVMGGFADFQQEMDAAGADWDAVLYGGAVHSFTVKEAGNDPSKGMAYDADADRRSWEALEDFLSEVLK